MSQPKSDLNEVIKRLRHELAFTRDRIAQVELVIRMDREFDGLSLIGGVKTILRRFHEEKDKNFELERELLKYVTQQGRS